MTIKEAEIRTGLARANIRYYEEQGFFTPARGENGYRDYSEENIETLLKVKLLRQLGFSLEEISAIQRGERPLEPALAEREAGLERESRELDQAARLCRDMRADGVDFYTLDARRYLYRLAREEAVLERDRDPVRVFPWRRFFARDLDLIIYTTLVTVILQLTARMNFVRTGSLLPSLLGLFLMTGGEIIMLHFWGTTPGKALLGLKILREDGTPLSLEEATQRTLLVMAFFGGGLLLAHVRVSFLPGRLLTALTFLTLTFPARIFLTFFLLFRSPVIIFGDILPVHMKSEKRHHDQQDAADHHCHDGDHIDPFLIVVPVVVIIPVIILVPVIVFPHFFPIDGLLLPGRRRPAGTE